MAWVRKAESSPPDENSQPLGNGGNSYENSSTGQLAATAAPFVIRSGSYNSRGGKGSGGGGPNYGGAQTYESNGTVYFVNTSLENRERSTVTSSGQHVIILGKAVNAERHCEFNA